MSDPAYESLHKQVHALHFKVHDAIDDPHHATAHKLTEAMEDLENDLERQKNLRDIENRIKVVQNALLEARSTQHGYMSIDDADHFYRTFEDMRRAVRSMPHY